MDLKALLRELSEADAPQSVREAVLLSLKAIDVSDNTVVWLARRGVTWTGRAEQPPEPTIDDGTDLCVRTPDGTWQTVRAVRAVGLRLVCQGENPNGGFRVRSIAESEVAPQHWARFARLLAEFQAAGEESDGAA